MRTVLVCFAFLFAACAPVQAPPPAESTSGNPSRVLLSVELLSRTAARLTLDNGERNPVGYNLCTSTLERRAGTTWTVVRTDEVCTMQLATLNPGADATFQKSLPPNVPAGEYRYVTSVESPLGTAQRSVASKPFTLR